MAEITGSTSINAPIQNVWDVMTRTDQDILSAQRFIRDVSYEPSDTASFELNTRIAMKLAIARFSGLVVMEIVELNPDEYYYDTSLIKGPSGMRANSRISLQPLKEDSTELTIASRVNLPFFMNRLLPTSRLESEMNEKLTGMGGIIAEYALRTANQSDASGSRAAS